MAFRYSAPRELSSLFEDFRLMCNDAIMIAAREKPKSRFRLIGLAYERLKEYGLDTRYLYSACEVAFSAYRNPMRSSAPYMKRAFLKLGNEAYRLDHLLLRIPTTPRHYIFLTLQGSNHHFSVTEDQNLRRGSVTITDRVVSSVFSKEIRMTEPTGYVGVDVNERNVAMSATDGYCNRFEQLGEVVGIKERYRAVKARIGRTMRQDRRISRKLYAKYGERERNRTIQRVHSITKKVVDYAARHKFGIKVEKLTGIRRLYKKGNNRSSSFRGRMNTWVFWEIQRQIEYKSKWDGIPVYFVNPRGTSRNCPDCGSRVVPLQDRKLYCPMCDKTWDRDDLASKNIMACAVPQDRSPRGSDEMERDDDSNPSSRWAEVELHGLYEPKS